MAGQDDIAPSVEIQGTEEALDKLKALGDGGEAAFNKIAKAAEEVGSASQGIEKLATQGAEAFGHLASAGAEAFTKIIDAAMSGNFAPLITKMFGETAGAVAEATQKIFEFIDAQAQAIETLSNLADATGMSTAEILGLREAFASVGISTQGFERSIGRLAITIASQWSEIQQAVRTSSDAQISAMLQVEQASFNVQKAYTSMGEALRQASSSQAHDSLSIKEAALNLAKAQEALHDSALTARSNSLAVESAELALVRARMNLRKDQGYGVSEADEKALKIEQDKLAVKDAELRLDEAKNKKNKEMLEQEQLQLGVKKARLELADAEAKAQSDAIKNADHIKQAELDIQKAKLASREAQEKSHEADLKDIPAIAKQIDQVAQGYKKWEDVINHTEISAGNLTKALILASSPGGGQEPKAMDVFREMSKLFANMGDSADAMNKKLEIVQHTMGAGFRAGAASAAQINAILARGPEHLEHFKTEMEGFAKSLGVGELGKSTDSLKEFNSALAQLEGAFDVVKSKMAAMMAVSITPFFEAMRESITHPGGALNELTLKVAEFIEAIGPKLGAALKGLGEIIAAPFSGAGPAVARLADLVVRVVGVISDLITALGKITGLWGEIGGGAKVWSLVAIAVDSVNIAIDGLKGAIAGALIGLGELYAWYLKVTGQAKTLADARKNELMQTGKDMMKGAIADTKKDTANLGIDASTFAGLKTAAEKQQSAADKTNQGADKLSQSGDKHGEAATKLTDSGGKVADGGQKLSDAATTITSSLGGAGDKLLTAAAGLTSAAAAIVTAAANLAKPAAVGGKATGGKITGPGGPTSDTAGLFALSDGEYVVKSAAVSHYGEGLFEALNSLSVGGFATGGAVGGARGPSVSSGGLTGGPQSILNLTIDGQQFNGLKAPEHVASKLKTYAVGRQSSSAGKMPSWMR